MARMRQQQRMETRRCAIESRRRPPVVVGSNCVFIVFWFTCPQMAGEHHLGTVFIFIFSHKVFLSIYYC
jgi:hypothetical protein